MTRPDDDVCPHLAHARELRVLRRIARRIEQALAGHDREAVAAHAQAFRGSCAQLTITNARVRDLLDDIANLRKVKGH